MMYGLGINPLGIHTIDYMEIQTNKN